jgi:hypothetical protein
MQEIFSELNRQTKFSPQFVVCRLSGLHPSRILDWRPGMLAKN